MNKSATLSHLCLRAVFRWLFELLRGKKKNLCTQWIVHLEDWIKAMGIEEIRTYLSNFCITSIFDAFLSFCVQELKEARFHDILICFYLIFLTEYSAQVEIPLGFKLDQVHRTFLLKILTNYRGLKRLDFKCYSGHCNFYISQEEEACIIQ